MSRAVRICATDIDDLVQEAALKIQGTSFATGLELQDKRKRVLCISTGSKAVDGILGGTSSCMSTALNLTFI